MGKNKKGMKEVAQEVCAVKRVGRMRTGTNCWNDELKQMGKEKRKKV